MNVSEYIVGSSARLRVTGRTDADFAALIATVKDDPETWYVYSIHMNMPSAHNRASRLRGPATPNALVPFKENLEFKAHRHVAHGPVVLVRWVPRA